MRHLVVIAVMFCAVFEDVFAQNRGSSRYVPPEDYDGESTRAPRPAPARGAGLRRGQRPTAAPEEDGVVVELKPYQKPESPPRTTGRRVPQRASIRQIAPPPPPPPLPVEEPIQYHPAPEGQAIDTPATIPEERPQGTRRRRPKKRRKNQTVVPKVEDELDKQVPENKESISSDLINDDRKTGEAFQGNPQLRNSPPNFDSEPNHIPPPAEQSYRNTAGPQHFRPQPASHRLPLNANEQGGDSGYVDSSPRNSNNDNSNGYVPRGHSSSIRNEGNYVPILTPIRVPSEGTSRLPPEDYSSARNRESSRQPTSEQGNRYHDPNKVTEAKPTHNNIPGQDAPATPVRDHSEGRLPEAKQPLNSPEYGHTNFDSDDRLPVPQEPKESEINEAHNPSNRLPNPSEIHYDSAYPEYSDNPQRVVRGRAESGEPDGRRTVSSSYSSPRRGSETKPQEHDNDAEFDRRQASQYRPPLQRTSSRYKDDDASPDGITRSRTQQQQPSTPPPRSRSPSRYQPSTDDNEPVRTRNSERYPIESPNPPPARTRSSSSSQSSTTRGSQRYVPENVQSAPRTTSRRQPVPSNTNRHTGHTPAAPARTPSNDVIKPDHRLQPNAPRTYNQQPTDLRAENEPEDYPVRNTLRSRPQYEVRDAEPENAYEESAEDPNTYENEYQEPQQPIRTNQRTPQPRQPPPRAEYQPPQNRQQPRPESHYDAPQNPRPRQQPQYHPQNSRSRQQPQYDAPQHPREEYRQPSPRQNVPSPRQQGRSRQQEPEAPRSSGGSKFRCPDANGFFADPVQCDKYYDCRNGTAEMHLCSDGLAFNEISAPKFVRCDSIRDVNCKSRPELQEPQSSNHCPRRFGLFPHETDCTKFWNCVDGTATDVQCPPGLTYNDELGTCDWADLVETSDKSCKSEELLGFTCPEATVHDLQEGVYTTYPDPSNCQRHFACIKGADGQRRPRMLSCNEGLVYDATSKACTRPDEVPGCEDFYGPPRPAKKKPAPRDPEPEEEYYEEPTPSPRRRPSSNRRARN